MEAGVLSTVNLSQRVIYRKMTCNAFRLTHLIARKSLQVLHRKSPTRPTVGWTKNPLPFVVKANSTCRSFDCQEHTCVKFVVVTAYEKMHVTEDDLDEFQMLQKVLLLFWKIMQSVIKISGFPGVLQQRRNKL